MQRCHWPPSTNLVSGVMLMGTSLVRCLIYMYTLNLRPNEILFYCSFWNYLIFCLLMHAFYFVSFIHMKVSVTLLTSLAARQVYTFSFPFPVMSESASYGMLRPPNPSCCNLFSCSVCLHWEVHTWHHLCWMSPPVSWGESIICGDLNKGWLCRLRIEDTSGISAEE